jgi:excinuclease UvrABC helicase subunit UvrB
MRAIGLCVSIGHAQFMADWFARAGVTALALTSRTDTPGRREAIEQLKRGELKAIFTVDLFNEVVDLPTVDTILMLRPTESATIFLQQLEGSTVHLFVRESKERDGDLGAPSYLYARPITYVRHSGDRPMRVIWRLKHSLPADVFHAARVAAG